MILVIFTSIVYHAGMGKMFSEQLRQAIEQCGLTRYRISQLTGIDQAALSRFHNGKAGLPLASIDILCELLGARLVVESKPRPKRKPKTKGR